MLTEKILHLRFDMQRLEPLTIYSNSLVFSYQRLHMCTCKHDCLRGFFSCPTCLLSCLCHWTKSCNTVHVNCTVEQHVADIWQKCCCVNNSEKCELMYCNFSFYYITVIKNYGECCCWVRSNGKAGIFNMGSGMSNLSNSVCVTSFKLVWCSKSGVSYGWEKVCFKVSRKSWITNNA